MARIKLSVSNLKGKTLTDVNYSQDCLFFKCSDDSEYEMSHQQDCCEHVRLIDGFDDLKKLIGDEIKFAQESTQKRAPNGNSETWTFYKLSTLNASATLRWHGESNGYYSEDVDFNWIVDDRLMRRINDIRFFYILSKHNNKKISQMQGSIDNWSKETWEI